MNIFLLNLFAITSKRYRKLYTNTQIRVSRSYLCAKGKYNTKVYSVFNPRPQDQYKSIFSV